MDAVPQLTAYTVEDCRRMGRAQRHIRRVFGLRSDTQEEYLNIASRRHGDQIFLQSIFCILGLSNGAKSRICCTLSHSFTLFYRFITAFQCGSTLSLHSALQCIYTRGGAPQPIDCIDSYIQSHKVSLSRLAIQYIQSTWPIQCMIYYTRTHQCIVYQTYWHLCSLSL